MEGASLPSRQPADRAVGLTPIGWDAPSVIGRPSNDKRVAALRFVSDATLLLAIRATMAAEDLTQA